MGWFERADVMSADESAVILQHGAWGPPDLLVDWLRSRSIPFEVHETWRGGTWPALERRAFVAVLGSVHSPLDAEREPEVAAELALLRRAVKLDVPVLGLCYGAQMLAVALGGSTEPAPMPEVGWHEVQSEEPDAIPPGPWLQWHFQRFTTPPGARQLAASPVGPQAFRHGRHLGVQFHPESTVETVRGWAASDRARLLELGLGDGESLLRAPEGRVARAESDAFQLFEAFWLRTRS